VIGQTLLGRYTVQSLVAEGGMGVVYRATDPAGRVVGVKRMRTEMSATAEVLARFEREAKAQSMLTHPNIAAIHAVGATKDGVPFFVMELVEGPGLAQELERGPLPVARALRIGGQVLSALSYAHQFGLVHRDLKPDNVLLAAPRGPGQFEQAKVIDFGLVKLLDDMQAGESAGALTAQGVLFGTPQYMSPEHITGETIDARSDLYAMGVLLFVMLTGRPPFDHPEITELWRAHMHAPIPSLSQFNPALTDPDLDAVVSTLLAKRRDDRFDSATAARRALLSVARGPRGARA
jgi:serine/threonine-protein kinase